MKLNIVNNPTQTQETVEILKVEKKHDLKEGNVRISYVVRAETRERLKAYQYTTRKKPKHVLDEIINQVIDAWEAEGNVLLYPEEE